MGYSDIDKIRDLCDRLKYEVENTPNFKVALKTWEEIEQPLKRLIKLMNNDKLMSEYMLWKRYNF